MPSAERASSAEPPSPQPDPPEGPSTVAGDLPTGSFRQVHERERFSSRVFRVASVEVTDPEGELFTRDVVRHPGAVAVVPVGEDGTVSLVRQYRPAVGRAVLEVPAGTCDEAGEAPEETARRELAEEAGLRADDLRLLARLFNTPGYSDQVTAIYLATGLTPCATDRSGVEERFMEVVTVGLDDLLAEVARGDVVDATTMVGLLLASRVSQGSRPVPPGTEARPPGGQSSSPGQAARPRRPG